MRRNAMITIGLALLLGVMACCDEDKPTTPGRVGLWHRFGRGVGPGEVTSLALLNDEPVAAGAFEYAGAVRAAYIARWDGQAWNSLGDTFEYAPGHRIEHITTYDSTMVVFCARENAVGSVLAWADSVWLPLNDVSDPQWLCVTEATAVFGGDLVVGGRFYPYSGSPGTYLARWNGMAWLPFEVELFEAPAGGVTSLAVYRGELIVAGSFHLTSGDTSYTHIARWTGTSWDPMAEGINNEPLALHVQDDRLYMAGRFTNVGGKEICCIASWDGTTWSPLGIGLTGDELPPGQVAYAQCLGEFRGSVIVAGYFTEAGGLPARNIARWNGTSWSALGSGVDGWIYALLECPAGLIAAGAFADAGGVAVSNIALWDEQ